MDIKTVVLIGIALAMDASAIALSIGLNCAIQKKNKFLFALSFAFFQFLFTLLGAIGGMLFEIYITSIPNIIGGIVIAIVGVMMIKEGMEQKEECILLKTKMYFILGISVSIDALVVGFTAFNRVGNLMNITFISVIIGIITLILSLTAFFASKYARKFSFITKYADYIGGAILIVFGFKMIFL
ncbi:Putative Mn2+ efflux pump MntP [Clostridium cavendishii DSM 21758]|uniref:Putative manganese efflux pump MntP n=1 Tax=Clostridium cavendishii DSM 21758 TaxID=1121302 RepID=A0A1M6CPZ4_9CLOT|nr:manganese efflux pump [Clostridium cavendishii]SHI63082.1 Putative Mn2+ efflux pump MntP [Clostridium cavendishii DSM 21758]